MNTGPFFNGKISVEGAPLDQDSRCSLYGNHSSIKEIYTMTINHLLCGSKVVVSVYFHSSHDSYILYISLVFRDVITNHACKGNTRLVVVQTAKY